MQINIIGIQQNPLFYLGTQRIKIEIISDTKSCSRQRDVGVIYIYVLTASLWCRAYIATKNNEGPNTRKYEVGGKDKSRGICYYKIEYMNVNIKFSTVCKNIWLKTPDRSSHASSSSTSFSRSVRFLVRQMDSSKGTCLQQIDPN